MTTEVAADIREQLAISLDVDDLVEARRLAKELTPYFGVAKIGLELFTAVGPDIVGIIADYGYKIFLDVKLHDSPQIVERAARVMGSIGVSYLTLHAFGGAPMLRAGVDGLTEGAARAGLDAPVAIAVTILTGDQEAPPYVLGNRVRAAIEGGCKGVTCSAPDIHEVKQLGPRLMTVVSGVRVNDGAVEPGEEPTTPNAAVESGADLLVIGRSITGAEDRVAASEELIAAFD